MFRKNFRFLLTSFGVGLIPFVIGGWVDWRLHREVEAKNGAYGAVDYWYREAVTNERLWQETLDSVDVWHAVADSLNARLAALDSAGIYEEDVADEDSVTYVPYNEIELYAFKRYKAPFEISGSFMVWPPDEASLNPDSIKTSVFFQVKADSVIVHPWVTCDNGRVLVILDLPGWIPARMDSTVQAFDVCRPYRN